MVELRLKLTSAKDLALAMRVMGKARQERPWQEEDGEYTMSCKLFRLRTHRKKIFKDESGR